MLPLQIVNGFFVIVRRSLLAIVFLAAACSSQAPPPPRAANPNRYIYVTAQSLSEQCYRDLGPVAVTESFAQATIDSGDSTMANRLRALALERYPRNADAVIHVKSTNNDAGTMTTVSGEAVEVENHTTAECVVRGMPPVVDGMAQVAAGGMVGTLVGGITTGSAQTAAGGGALGATVTGSVLAIRHHEKVKEQAKATHDQLIRQQQTIASLQNERARLNQCEQQETPLAQCPATVQATSSQRAATDKSDELDWNASQFDLEKQAQMQQDYIAKLRTEVGDLKLKMQGH